DSLVEKCERCGRPKVGGVCAYCESQKAQGEEIPGERGESNKDRWVRVFWWGGIGVSVVLVVVFAVLSAVFGPRDGRTGSYSTRGSYSTTDSYRREKTELMSEAERVRRATPCYTVLAVDLLKEYENAGVADLKYRGKVIIVEGTVRWIHVSRLGERYAIHLGEMPPGGVYCYFEVEDRWQLVGLKQWSWVRVKGVCKGELGGDVILEGCQLLGSDE
ncbi:MAG: OB-fold protein, partial [Candidatus Bipolaricaulaceae bacterium]